MAGIDVKAYCNSRAMSAAREMFNQKPLDPPQMLELANELASLCVPDSNERACCVKTLDLTVEYTFQLKA